VARSDLTEINCVDLNLIEIIEERVHVTSFCDNIYGSSVPVMIRNVLNVTINIDCYGKTLYQTAVSP
jgi:hypothetical protein